MVYYSFSIPPKCMLMRDALGISDQGVSLKMWSGPQIFHECIKTVGAGTGFWWKEKVSPQLCWIPCLAAMLGHTQRTTTWHACSWTSRPLLEPYFLLPINHPTCSFYVMEAENRKVSWLRPSELCLGVKTEKNLEGRGRRLVKMAEAWESPPPFVFCP